GMKYRLVGGVRFYQRREVKDLLAYLRLLHNPLDEVSLSRVVSVPPRGIGAKSIQEMTRWGQGQNIPMFTAMQRIAAARAAGEPCPVSLTSRAAGAIANFASLIDNLAGQSAQLRIIDLIDQVLEDTGFRRFIQAGDDRPEERWENILELRNAAQEFNAEGAPDGLASLLERISLVADVDTYEESEDAVTLITLHQAKGLEFPVVFIVGLEEGLLPHSRSMDSEEELEEERRLCYVGITRAKRRLYLMRAFRRGFMGAGRPTIASRFLRDIPQRLVAPARSDNSRVFETAQPVPSAGHPQTYSSRERVPVHGTEPGAGVRNTRLPLNVGNLVRHTHFGEGVVLSCGPAGGDHEVTIQFAGGVGVKRLLLSFAPLEKIPE
ncbi:MAG: 3'-5' exonuclease, partial [Chloroflexota bacterium]